MSISGQYIKFDKHSNKSNQIKSISLSHVFQEQKKSSVVLT